MLILKENKKIKELFQSYSQIKLVYLFGSTAKGKKGPMSDYDFAIYLSDESKSDIKIELMGRLSDILNTDKIDIVVLNFTESPELKFNIIKDGKLIYEVEPYKVLIEPAILRDYFDFYDMLKRNNLTKA